MTVGELTATRSELTMGNQNSYTLASSSLGVDFISRALDPGALSICVFGSLFASVAWSLSKD
jgi:hypothetical protein